MSRAVHIDWEVCVLLSRNLPLTHTRQYWFLCCSTSLFCLTGRVSQELIAERTAFREAMQQTMEDVSPAQTRQSTALTPIGKKVGGGVFKSVVGSRGKI